MSLMGSIYVGTSGLQAQNNALNTSAHNLANIETKGYTRQQVLLGNKFYNTIGNAAVSDMQVGIGVDYTKCRQVRDEFLDASYRKEAGRSAFYEICSESTGEIETLLGEMEGASFADSLRNLWTAVEELQKDPSSTVTQGLFVSTCSQFLERAKAVSDGINNYQANLNSRIKGVVDDVNDIADRIFVLNNKIQKNEIGVEEANDLRDERNYLLDQLSSKVSIKVVENAHGGVEVYAEGTPLIIGDLVNHMEVVKNDSGFDDVTWGPLYDYEAVYNFHREISSDMNTDIGELKSLLINRGDHVANYSDITDSYKYNYGTDGQNDIPVASSVVMTVQAEFDRLIHNVVTSINNVLTDNSKTKAGTDSVEMFVRLGTERYDAAGNYVTEETAGSPADVSTMYTVSNLKVNPDLLKQPTLNKFIKDDKSVDYDKAKLLAEVFSGSAKIMNLNNDTEQGVSDTINPNTNTKLNFVDFYSGMCGQLANTGSVYNSICTSQQATVNSLDSSRQSVLGVSSDDELQSIIKYQNAYNASSRYINVVNEMLERLLSSLG